MESPKLVHHSLRPSFGTAILLALLCVPASGSPAQAQLIDGEGIIALTGATVIDGASAGPRQNTTVVVKESRILYVGDAANVRFGAGVRVTDLKGRWVVPGFIDTHAHLPNRDGAASFLAQLIAFGATTIRAAANPRVELRDLVARGVVLGPRLLVAGLLIDGKDSDNGGARAGTENEVRDVVRRQAEQKVDFIKLYVGLSPNLVRAAIDEAHRHGLRVIGHLGATTWTEAAEMGIDSLAHSWYSGMAHSIVPAQYQAEFRDFYIPNDRFDPSLFRKWREVAAPDGPEVERLVSLLLKHHIEVAPNLVLGEAVTWGDDPSVLAHLEPEFAPAETAAAWRRGRHPYSSNWSAEAMAEAKRAFPQMAQVIRVFHERGVLMTVGTDYMNPWMTPGVAFHRELELLAAAGIPPIDVLRMATRNGAEALGVLNETGTIEAGKRADLVVLTADPLVSIANTRKIERVFLRGRSLEPAQLLGPR